MLDGCRIGQGAVIGAGSVVSGRIAPFSIVSEIPPKWSSTVNDAPASVIAALRQRALTQPGAPFIADGERWITFGEMWTLACQVRHALLGRGVAAGARVVLEVPSQPWRFVAAYFGTHLAGAIAVPVSASRSGRMLQSCSAPAPRCTWTPRRSLLFLKNALSRRLPEKEISIPITGPCNDGRYPLHKRHERISQGRHT